MRIYLLLAIAAGVSFIGSSCGGSGVGDPCTPEDEYLTGFSGFSRNEVNVESRSFQCLTRVCLVNHFEGRVSCPYGQEESASGEGLSECMSTETIRNSEWCQPGGELHRKTCQVPSRDGSFWSDRIVAKVTPQFENRQAEEAVYCSCRCEDENGNSGDGFCECPAAFKCEPLVDDLGLSGAQLAGSYCIKDGTEYIPTETKGEPCDTKKANCDDEYNIEVDGTIKGRNQESNKCLPPGALCGDNDTCCDAPVKTGESFPHGELIEGKPTGGTELFYEATRSDCKKDDVCPAWPVYPDPRML